jgi:nucleoside-diphosphate-sugar epimerase
MTMILLTGNAGFIGRYLTTALLKSGNEIRGLDINPRKDIERGLTQIDGNILDKETVRKAMTGAESVIHLAAEHKDFGLVKEQYYKTNVEGTKVLLNIAAKTGVAKFVFYSSVAVYGAQSSTTEETTPLPSNPYGASKFAAEKEVIRWAEEDKRRTAIIVRPTVVFGPNSKANIFRLIRQICDGKFIMVGNGDNIKSVAYVENLVDATFYLMDHCSTGINIYNYADEPHMQTRELVSMIRTVAGRKSSKFYIPLNLAVAGGFGFDILGKITGIDFPINTARMRKFTMPTYHQAAKIRSFGFKPQFSIETGLQRHIEWYREGGMTINKESDSLE